MKFFNAILSAAAILFSTYLPAQVHRSPNGVGGALILPYWTTSVGNDSLLSIRNDSERASAIKLLWLDEQGGLVLSANLYLNAQSVWTGAATDELNPRMVHLVQPNACLLPLELNQRDGASPDVLGFPLGAPRGSMEIIEMGSIAADSSLAPEGQWIDCDTLAERWSDGPWAAEATADLLPPTGRLSANNNLINVALGGMNTIEATALGGFSDIVQHTLPNDPTPDLSDAVDADAPLGGVRSSVCLDGQCLVDEWAVPIEAVAAVLMTSRVWTDYEVIWGLSAKFEWLLHRPLDRYKTGFPGLEFGTVPLISYYGRWSGKYVYCRNGCLVPVLPPPGALPPGTSDFPIDLEPFQHVIALVEFIRSNEGPVEVSPLLGHPIGRPLEVPDSESVGEETFSYDAGRSRFMFSEQSTPLTASSGRVFVGEPVIAIGFQQFTSIYLQGGVLANYRGTEAPRYEHTIIGPD